MKHLIKIESTAHGVLGVRHAGRDQQYCEAGELVTLKWQPDAKWGLQEAHYTDGDGNVTTIDLTPVKVNGKDEVVFTMPSANITVGGTFKRFIVQDWTEGTDPSTGEVLTIGDNGEPTPTSTDDIADLIASGDNDIIGTLESPNKLDPSACAKGYINKNTGAFASLTGNVPYATDYIPVSSQGLYCYRAYGYGAVGGNAVYDKNKQYLRGFTGNVYTYQDGDGYVRFTIPSDLMSTDTYFVVEGTTGGHYNQYFDSQKIINPKFAVPRLNPALSLCGSGGYGLTAASLSANEKFPLNFFPQYLKANGIVSFSAKLTTFDEITLGFGTSSNAIQVKVDSTNIYLIKDGTITLGTFAHGLTVADFIDLTFDNDLAAPKVILATSDGIHVEQFSQYASLDTYGTPTAIMGVGTAVTNAQIRATSDKFRKPIWVVGDSYVSLYQERWTYQMINTIGIDDFMIMGLAGDTGFYMLPELQKALYYGTPRFLLWTLGMNGTYLSWNGCYQKVKEICEDNGIELILQTIPIPNLSTSDEQIQINAAVKASGFRYIDAAAAMSPNSSYPWYTGYCDDGIHPTTLGAQVLAARFLSDFPEFMH